MRRALLVDLYEMTMAAVYHSAGMVGPATFELFFRELPEHRNFLISCGADQALDYLESLQFTPDDVDYLRSLGIFEDSFLDMVSELRFTGDVWAVPEGEAVFPPEPVLRVTGPLIEAQIVETYLLNCINFSTMVASKAARVAIASGGRTFVDFSTRRDHGADAAVLAARASYISGAASTSNLLAGSLYGIPVAGTMAHSYVMAHRDEREAFRVFARKFPDRSVLLIDTFDSLQGARNAAEVATELGPEGIRVTAVRLDSGDIASLAKQVRSILDGAGHPQIEIFASGDLDEYEIARLLAEGAPIDAFGVGTRMGTSGDAPWLGGVYKLVEASGVPVLKRSPGKASLGGVKQVFRHVEDGRLMGDRIALASEDPPEGGMPLLGKAMTGGRRLAPPEPLEQIRQRCRSTLDSLPLRLRSLRKAPAYEVSISKGLSESGARRVS